MHQTSDLTKNAETAQTFLVRQHFNACSHQQSHMHEATFTQFEDIYLHSTVCQTQHFQIYTLWEDLLCNIAKQFVSEFAQGGKKIVIDKCITISKRMWQVKYIPIDCDLFSHDIYDEMKTENDDAKP